MPWRLISPAVATGKLPDDRTAFIVVRVALL
jgi:hypothetical protein